MGKTRKAYGMRTPEYAGAAVNRMYKPRIFKMIFSDRKELLSLYNAVNQTDYKDPERYFFYRGHEAESVRASVDLQSESSAALSFLRSRSVLKYHEGCESLQYAAD